MSRHQLVSAWRAAPFAEIAWIDEHGRLDAATVVPLTQRDHPAVALTYDRVEVGQALARAQAVLLSVTSPVLGGGNTPVSAWAHVSVHEDPRGQEFQEQLLPQELAKHPPARRFADSMLLRSEHPWYLPRVLIRATRLEEIQTHPFRDALALSAPGGAGMATTVDLEGDGEAAGIRSPLPDGPVVILQHGADLPGLDQPWWRRWRGEIRDGALVTEEFAERPQHLEPLGVWRRWRDQVAFEKACRAGIRDATGP
ncbi:hypothetical protein [Egicoccus sp. AB-alg6-2]|uniref:hypothetical protein n=1 Tax=Egicoccus sp. AB-alg6-2 TaxID=3242692 RepID=UPI00359EE7C4